MAHRRWYLTRQFALKDFKIRYTSTALGYAWSVLNPLVFALLYYLVFSIFARFDIPNYPAYLILGDRAVDLLLRSHLERDRVAAGAEQHRDQGRPAA